MRLDKYIQTHFSLKSRTYAENLIKTGCVTLNGVLVKKTSANVGDTDVIEILNDDNYASQGAYKLEEAFKVFDIDVHGKRCVDIGCSNGGFTDCLLRHGADYVLAIDVAECCLDEQLLSSGRVEFLRANARELPKDICGYDFVCSDVSFISLKYILPGVYSVLNDGGSAVMLIKPQFELDKSALNKNGIVTDEKLRMRAVNSIIACAQKIGFVVERTAMSPIRYDYKNVEYLMYLKK